MTRLVFYLAVLIMLGAPWWLYVLLIVCRILDTIIKEAIRS